MTLALIKTCTKDCGGPVTHRLLSAARLPPGVRDDVLGPEWRPLPCGLLSLNQLSSVTSHGAGHCAENSPVRVDQETPVLPVTSVNFKKEEGVFLIFHFDEGALIVLMATRGRKPGAIPRSPNLLDPTWPLSGHFRLHCSRVPLLSAWKSLGILGFCWNPQVKVFSLLRRANFRIVGPWRHQEEQEAEKSKLSFVSTSQTCEIVDTSSVPPLRFPLPLPSCSCRASGCLGTEEKGRVVRKDPEQDMLQLGVRMEADEKRAPRGLTPA